MLDKYGGWAGWSIQVQGPGGRFGPYPFPGAVEPPTAADLIELRPGESVGVVINLGGYVRSGVSSATASPAVLGTPGNYTVTSGYHYETDKVYSHADPASGLPIFASVSQMSPVESVPQTFIVPGAPAKAGKLENNSKGPKSKPK